ncbi:MAG TPA: glycoside hydrolase family 2 TIM barrel-domain containing protein [Candidatus Brocadiia bacterium]|nr:glycoside hydrolase family 2 TIM barrel-domain containing protein [Candidatus Brocadiia bacterium]
MKVPRPEHPRPQSVRESWLNLNGEWEFEIDNGVSGEERGLTAGRKLSGKIIVPFCPESPLSGVGNLDFMKCVWYRRKLRVPSGWKGMRVLLHFGAVDYEARVWVNGKRVGTHKGGNVGFSLDITDALTNGNNELVVCALDDVRTGLQPAGKQSWSYDSRGCNYRRTTGIWQTVWLEAVPQSHIRRFRLEPDLASGTLLISADCIKGAGLILCAVASAGRRTAGCAETKAGDGMIRLVLKLDKVVPWEPGNPFLYDLRLSLKAGDKTVDSVSSYFGMREIRIEGRVVLINGKPVFQRLVLDQGYYPKGILTAPSDSALKKDIALSMAMGFNGARLHQKVFEERFLYWADRLGYLCWGEFADWKADVDNPATQRNFLEEWLQVVERDFNHPCIVGWCPFNERHGLRDQAFMGVIYDVTKAIDQTRPALDVSGYDHVRCDVYDSHDYDQNPATFKARHDAMIADESKYFTNFPDRCAPRKGQPYFVSEYGGIWWNPGQKDQKAWGYGDRPKSEKEFVKRFRLLTHALMDNPKMFAFCYTQLTDVEQEVNGLYTFDRKPKFDPAAISAIMKKKAAIENQP